MTLPGGKQRKDIYLAAGWSVITQLGCSGSNPCGRVSNTIITSVRLKTTFYVMFYECNNLFMNGSLEFKLTFCCCCISYFIYCLFLEFTNFVLKMSVLLILFIRVNESSSILIYSNLSILDKKYNVSILCCYTALIRGLYFITGR